MYENKKRKGKELNKEKKYTYGVSGLRTKSQDYKTGIPNQPYISWHVRLGQ